MITLDGYSLEYFGLILQPGHEHPMLPSTVDRTMAIPGMNGQWDFGATLGPRYFAFPLAFGKEVSRFELQRKARVFSAFLLDGNGRPRDIKLVFDYEPDVYYTVKLVGNVVPERLLSLGFFTIKFVAFDPSAYSLIESNDIDVDSPLLVDSEITVDAEYMFTLTSPATLQIDNYGTQLTEPLIEIAGSFATLSLLIGGVETTYSAAMSGLLELDFAKKTAKVGGSNVLGNTNGNFGRLPTGLSDVVVGGTDLDIAMTIQFKAKFI